MTLKRRLMTIERRLNIAGHRNDELESQAAVDALYEEVMALPEDTHPAVAERVFWSWQKASTTHARNFPARKPTQAEIDRIDALTPEEAAVEFNALMVKTEARFAWIN